MVMRFKEMSSTENAFSEQEANKIMNIAYILAKVF